MKTEERVILNRAEFDNSPRNLAIKTRFLGHYYWNPKLIEFLIIEFSPSKEYIKIVELDNDDSESKWRHTKVIIVDEQLNDEQLEDERN